MTVGLPGTEVPIHCLIGGKWTTFRAFSEQVADRVLDDLGRARSLNTAGLAIGGGRGFPREPEARRRFVAEIARTGGVTEARASLLLSRYGTRASDYCAVLAGQGETMLTALPDHACEEIRHIATTERVGTVDDILRRRTLIALTGRGRPEVRAEIAALLDMPRPPGPERQIA